MDTVIATGEYRQASRWADGAMRLLNTAMVLVLSVPALGIVAVIYLFRLVRERGFPKDFIYGGERLGLHGEPFTMYKIRTLQVDTNFEQQGIILPPGSGRELHFGEFLRESRLDELPQLWNVLRGDMNMVGPRPLRRAIYEKLRQRIPHCGRRFQVKPGMTGYSQFLTPSHTPKRIRIAIDNHFVMQGNQPFKELFLIGWTILVVAYRIAIALLKRIGKRWILFRKYGNGIEHRKLKRIHPRCGWLQLSDVHFSDKDGRMLPIFDINYAAFSVILEAELPAANQLYFFLTGSKARESGPKKRARCCGYVRDHYPMPDSSGLRKYVISYEPISELHRYLVDHYVLHDTVA